MVSKISGISQITTAQSVEGSTGKKPEQTQSKSIFEAAQTEETQKKNNGKGLGVGQIPPGLQKKIDSGKSLPEKLVAKFQQLADALKAKEEANAADEAAIADDIAAIEDEAIIADEVAAEPATPVETAPPAVPPAPAEVISSLQSAGATAEEIAGLKGPDDVAILAEKYNVTLPALTPPPAAPVAPAATGTSLDLAA